MNTKKFKTKTEFVHKNNGKIEGKWPIATDIGYSGVKLFSPNTIARFPSYALKISEDFNYLLEAPENSIMVRDMTKNELWLVGEQAQNQIDVRNATESENTLYGRDRYSSPMFAIIIKASLGIGLLENEYAKYSGEEIVVQSGLPELYMSDENVFRDVIAGHHHFAIKVGNNDWVEYNFTIKSDNVYIMSQPKGTLLSVCIDNSGAWHPEAKNYLNSSVLVFDPGFGTLDLFPIRSGAVGRGETFSDLGMKRVLQETVDMINDEYQVKIPVAAMQPYLEKGTVRVGNIKTFNVKDEPFGDLLAKANRKVFEEAIERMVNSVNLMDFNYMIVTGGTGAAWKHYIEDKFKNFSTLTILHGNQNDKLPFVYCNVRGYYLYRFNMLARGAA